MSEADSNQTAISLKSRARIAILVVAFLGWFFGGVQISITNLAMRSSAIDLMDEVGWIDSVRFAELTVASGSGTLDDEDRLQLDSWNGKVTQWYAWFQCAFLFGAALGGFLFGRLGDSIGRTRALAVSILCFSALTGAACFAQNPVQLLLLRFLACLGIGGTWPNGVSLVSEAWRDTARPIVASAIGMAGNLGIFGMSTLAAHVEVTPESWRWVMIVGATPVVLAAVIWRFIPESPNWLASRRTAGSEPKAKTPTRSIEIFSTSYRGITFIGIALATIPLIGGWGSANWMIPWADEAGAMSENSNPFLKAHVGQARAITSIIGSLLGGWLACTIGRRTCYFLTSLGALLVAQYAFWFTTPIDRDFLIWVAVLGFFNGVYFGWLPFFLPELFPTRLRATGTGVTFNFGRILTAITIFLTGAMFNLFQGDYAQIGRVTSLIFLLGLIVIPFAPDTSKRDLTL